MSTQSTLKHFQATNPFDRGEEGVMHSNKIKITVPRFKDKNKHFLWNSIQAVLLGFKVAIRRRDQFFQDCYSDLYMMRLFSLWICGIQYIPPVCVYSYPPGSVLICIHFCKDIASVKWNNKVVVPFISMPTWVVCWRLGMITYVILNHPQEEGLFWATQKV